MSLVLGHRIVSILIVRLISKIVLSKWTALLASVICVVLIVRVFGLAVLMIISWRSVIRSAEMFMVIILFLNHLFLYDSIHILSY